MASRKVEGLFYSWVCGAVGLIALAACYFAERDVDLKPCAHSVTGRYRVVMTMLVDTCAPEDDDLGREVDFGEWVLAVTEVEAVLTNGKLMLFAPLNGENIDTFTRRYAEPLSCGEESSVYEAALRYEPGALSGLLSVVARHRGCPDSEGVRAYDVTCSFVWAVSGRKL
jgi:hypothetical protein